MVNCLAQDAGQPGCYDKSLFFTIPFTLSRFIPFAFADIPPLLSICYIISHFGPFVILKNPSYPLLDHLAGSVRVTVLTSASEQTPKMVWAASYGLKAETNWPLGFHHLSLSCRLESEGASLLLASASLCGFRWVLLSLFISPFAWGAVIKELAHCWWVPGASSWPPALQPTQPRGGISLAKALWSLCYNGGNSPISLQPMTHWIIPKKYISVLPVAQIFCGRRTVYCANFAKENIIGQEA